MASAGTILQYIAQNPGARAIDIAPALRMAPHDLTPILRAMLTLGSVRSSSAGKGRRYYAIVPKGKRP